MQIKLTITVDVDADAWGQESAASSGEVSQDIRRYLEQEVRWADLLPVVHDDVVKVDVEWNV